MTEVNEVEQRLTEDMDYKYEDLHSRPFITPESEIPENLLHFSHSFGYDCRRRANLHLLDEETLIFIAGNLLVLLGIPTKEQRYLRSCSGEGIGSITVHPSKEFFAAAEKGNQPLIIVYEYPSLQPHRILRGGTERVYGCVDFNSDGSLLASIGDAPDYTLTVWDWRQEAVVLSGKAISQEVYRVGFSSYHPQLLTSSGSGHIKFWKMSNTFTGLRLQGTKGSFGLTETTDVEGFFELPDEKVLCGSSWGNLLLWDRSDVILEICRPQGQTCHIGTVQPFALEDEQLFTFGSDGAVRVWNIDGIVGADKNCSRCEMEPLNELIVGRNVCLSSIIKSSRPESFIWFAQDSRGAIWKLDLSFTSKSLDPACLFSFHSGKIRAMDVSKNSHLMATAALDCSVRVFDFVENRELIAAPLNQGGTTLLWAPLLVSGSGCLLVIGFEDGVVRLSELYDPHKLRVSSRLSSKEEAKLRCKQVFKPHSAAVTAVAFDRNGEILATGSADCTVFFFTVGEKYEPIGFVPVPGAVQALEWSPQTHPENRLLILCQNGHVVEVHRPGPETQQRTETFQLFDLPRRSFRFRSIKSHIKREEEIARRQALMEKKKKEKEERLKESEQLYMMEEEEEEEEEEELPAIYVPETPGPLYCGFYSQPSQFWLSMGGFDSGFFYHCKFSENQEEDLEKRQDEPFDFLPVENADSDPICSVTFSSDRLLLFCGMHSGSVRVYPLQADHHSITSMQACWTLSFHDSDYGHIRHIRCSHDDRFVLTAGDDGNIFSYSLLPPRELPRKKAKVPSPRVGLENEAPAQEIEDPAAYSIEKARQKLQKDRLLQKAELKQKEKQKKLAEIQKKYDVVVKVNQSLPEHVRLKPEELQLDPRFYELVERTKAKRLTEERKSLAWMQERCTIAFNKLSGGFRNSTEANVTTVVAIHTDHRVCTYPPSAFCKPSLQQSPSSSAEAAGHEAAAEDSRSPTEAAEDSSHSGEDQDLPRPEAQPKMKLGDRQEAGLRRATERAEQARARIVKRNQEWAQLYAEKPGEKYEDPQDVQDIREAKENIGDVKLKSDAAAPMNLKMFSQSEREELNALEENMFKKQSEMNERILALRDSKVGLVSRLHDQAQQLQKLQQRLPAHLHRAPLPLPSILPQEASNNRLACDVPSVEQYRTRGEQRCKSLNEEEWHDGGREEPSLLNQMEKEVNEPNLCDSFPTLEDEEESVSEGAELSELEQMLLREEEVRRLYEQDRLLKKMESSVSEFDAELQLLRQQKIRLDSQLKQDHLCKLVMSQELQLLQQFEKNKGSLQEKLDGCIKEEKSIRSKLEDFKKASEQKQRDIAKLQDRERTLFTTFQDSLGENNPFEKFLNQVFLKKVKPVKREAVEDEDEEEDSEEDSDEDFDMDDDFASVLDERSVQDLNVCPSGCNPELFEYTLKLRERRVELEELRLKEKKVAAALHAEHQTLVNKEKPLKNRRKAAEDELEGLSREVQQKINHLDVVVPLRLHQIQFVTNNSMGSDLSEVLVLDNSLLSKLKKRIQQLKEENTLQKDLNLQACKDRNQLKHGIRDLEAKKQVLEEKCNELMIAKFGKLVDVDAVQMHSTSRTLEELKQKKILQQAAYDKEIKEWDVKIAEARAGLSEETKRNTRLNQRMSLFMEEGTELERQLRSRKLATRQPRHYSRRETQEDIRRLEEMVETQLKQKKILVREIELLSGTGGAVIDPSQLTLLSCTSLTTPTSRSHAINKGPVLPHAQVQIPTRISATPTRPANKDEVMSPKQNPQ